MAGSTHARARAPCGRERAAANARQRTLVRRSSVLGRPVRRDVNILPFVLGLLQATLDHQPPNATLHRSTTCCTAAHRVATQHTVLQRSTTRCNTARHGATPDWLNHKRPPCAPPKQKSAIIGLTMCGRRYLCSTHGSTGAALHPSAAVVLPDTRKSQRAACNMHHANRNMQHAWRNVQHATRNMLGAMCNMRCNILRRSSSEQQRRFAH